MYGLACSSVIPIKTDNTFSLPLLLCKFYFIIYCVVLSLVIYAYISGTGTQAVPSDTKMRKP